MECSQVPATMATTCLVGLDLVMIPMRHHLRINELAVAPATITHLQDPLESRARLRMRPRPRLRFPGPWMLMKVRAKVWKPLLSTRLSKKTGRVLRMSPAELGWCGPRSRPPR